MIEALGYIASILAICLAGAVVATLIWMVLGD
jgi:hypothetical protein